MKLSTATNHAAASCDSTRQLVLDRGLSASDDERLSDALAHLRACGECRAAVSDFDQLQQLLGDQLPSAETPAAVDWIASTKMPSRRRFDLRVLVRMGIAACAALAIAMGGYFAGRRPPQLVASIQTPNGRISEADVSERARAFTKVSKAFDNRAGWMLVSNSDSDVGLDAEPSAASGMLLLRLTVTRHQAVAGAAPVFQEIVSSADLAILPGRSARVSLPFPQDRVLSYEIEVGSGSPTHLGLTAELLPGPGASVGKPLAALSTSLDLRPGGSASAGSFVTGAAGYDITVGFATADLTGAQP